jgi:predicted unusual protein kinase regulating ubiquinone biosynthesis (AarF/ABC1/UbiB family)
VADYKYSLRGLARDSEDYQFKLSEVKSISLSLLQLFELHKTTITFLGYMVLQFQTRRQLLLCSCGCSVPKWLNYMAFLQVHLRSAKKLLKLCEANGGFYVKAGQFVSSLRQVPKEYTSTLSCLQDKVCASAYIMCLILYLLLYNLLLWFF